MLVRRKAKSSVDSPQQGEQASEASKGDSSLKGQRQVFKITATCLPPDQQTEQASLPDAEISRLPLTARSRLNSGKELLARSPVDSMTRSVCCPK